MTLIMIIQSIGLFILMGIILLILVSVGSIIAHKYRQWLYWR